MIKKPRGAIRSSLETVTVTAEVLELAMSIVKVNLQTTLEDELFEAEQARAELQAKRDALTKATK